MSAQPFVYLWTYSENRRNYPGWHLSIEPAQQNKIIAALEELRVVRPRRRGAVFLARPPTGSVLKIPNNRLGAAGWKFARRMHVNMPADYPVSYWELLNDGDAVRIGLGIDMLHKLIASIQKLCEGIGDFGIGPPESSPRCEAEWLTFWPRNHARIEPVVVR